MKMNYSSIIEKPFIDMGRGPDGFDCWGTVIYIRRMHGLYTPDYGVSAMDEERICSEYNLRKDEWIEVSKKEKPKICDVILFKQTGDGLHFGVVIEDRRFIQTTKEFGLHICRLGNPVLFDMIKCYYRFKNG